MLYFVKGKITQLARSTIVEHQDFEVEQFRVVINKEGLTVEYQRSL